MKKLFVLLGICSMMLIAIPSPAQDFYGANLTGRHTWGVNAKWDGKFWVGTHYNLRRFGSFGSRPLDVNLVAQIQIKKGVSGIAGELGFGQVYADGNDFMGSFGLGARYGFRAEHCPLGNKADEGEWTPSTNLSLQVALKPGYYNNDYAVAANIDTDIVKLYFGGKNTGYKKEGDYTKNIDVRIFERIGVGLHTDYTNSTKGSGRFHMTADVTENLYIGMKHNIAWDTFYNSADHLPVKADYEIATEEGNDGTCTMPERNLTIDMSMSLRF